MRRRSKLRIAVWDRFVLNHKHRAEDRLEVPEMAFERAQRAIRGLEAGLLYFSVVIYDEIRAKSGAYGQTGLR